MNKKNFFPAARNLLAIVLTLCLAFSLLTGLAEEAPGGEELTAEKLKTEITAFEQNHPELKDLLPALTAKMQEINQEEMRGAFTKIRERFEGMLEAEREKNGAPEDSMQHMREQLNLQASVLNADCIAHFKKSFGMLTAFLRDEAYPEDKTVIDLLKEVSAEMAASDDETVLSTKANLDQVIETAEKDYQGNLGAWFRELSARPELPPDAGDRPKDDSRPEPPPKGEKPADEGEPKDNPGTPFMDHFVVIREELQAALQQVDARNAEMLQSVVEQYQISEETAKEISAILSDLAGLVNAGMMKHLQGHQTALNDSLIHEAPDAPAAEMTP